MFRATTLLAVLASALAADLTSLVTEKCPESGQEAATCYSKQLNGLIKGVVGGVPELGLDVMDPFVTGALNLSVSAGADQFKMNFLTPKFIGLRSSRVTKLKVGNPLTFTLVIPTLKMTSSYVNSGRLILIKASGGGAMTNTFEDASLAMTVRHGTEERGGRRYATISSLDVKFTSKRSNMHVDRLNSGNAIALELYNVFLAASSQEILGLMAPQFNEKFSQIFFETAKKMMENLPLDAVFE